MKKSLREQIERIHTLTYGKKIIKEGFLDDLLGREVDEQGASSGNKIDNSNKADIVGKDDQGKAIDDPKLVEDFYNTFEKAISAGGLKEQSYGSMAYQKEVESMQIGLVLLGYQLPQHGIDGLFGPETAKAVQKFAADNNINISTPSIAKPVDENSQELRSTLSNLGYKEKGSELASGGEITDQLSSTVSDILADFKNTNPNVEVTATGGNDKFHQGLGYKSKHTEGQAVDLVINPFNDQNANAFISILDKYKAKDPQFNYIDEYRHPSGAATAGHFHLQYGKGTAQGGPSMAAVISATPDILKKLLDLVKQLGLTPQKLKEFIKKNVLSVGGGGVIDVKDWQGIINTIIDNLEGGYFSPEMLKDGRVNDSRFSGSGETMFGIDRLKGEEESNSPAGQEFWRIIDAQPNKNNWPREYMAKDNPELSNKLRELVAQMMKPIFDKFSRAYLSPESAAIVSKDPALTFHFAYATFNGSGWFRRFANTVNQAVASGNTDPKSILQIAMDSRTSTGNSLMDQVGTKVAKITNRIELQSPTATAV